MAHVRIWIHTVWATKNRTPFMQSKSKRIDLFRHIKSYATVPYYFFKAFNLPNKAVIASRYDEAICPVFSRNPAKTG